MEFQAEENGETLLVIAEGRNRKEAKENGKWIASDFWVNTNEN